MDTLSQDAIAVADSSPAKLQGNLNAAPPATASTSVEQQIVVLTGGYDKPYVMGLTQALAAQNVWMDVVGGDAIDSPALRATQRLRFVNLIGSREGGSLAAKVSRVLAYYARLIRYAATAEPKIFHILWNNKFEFFDRTLLMLYYRLLGKKIVFTAHNVNAGKRDGNDSFMNRLTLRAQYRLCDAIFVHTEKMRGELIKDFGVGAEKVHMIPFGINNSVPDTALTSSQARQQLGIGKDEKAILFFGALRPYKGLEYLVKAFLQLAANHPEYRLIIAGERRRESGDYPEEVLREIGDNAFRDRVLQVIRFIPDEQAELYFKAADVLALPYTNVFQSGVLFTAYGFGLPVVATDVGSMSEEVIVGKTGFLCEACDPRGLASAIEEYFASDLFRSLQRRRPEIREWAAARHSWSIVGETTCGVYAELLAR